MKVTIEAFQSIAKAALTFTGLSVIVGPSNHGKSAVLRAIEGALFNRPGEHVVRKGATNTVVEIEHLPGSGPSSSANAVRWTKGKANKYLIDGTEYARVGSSAPQPLQDAGYRDVWVGDADRKKGVDIRPQVAGQFEPLFLLTDTGSFISDVLGLMSRHHIVATAQDRCASDLRAAKQRLGVRTTDREALDIKRAVLDVSPVLTDVDRARIHAKLQEAHQLEQLRAIRVKRAATAAIPHPGAITIAYSERILREVERIAQLDDLLAQRTLYLRVLAAPVPGVSVPSLDPVLNLARAVAGIKRRRVLATIAPPSTKALPVVHAAAVDELRALVVQRRQALDAVFQTQQAFKAASTEAETTALLLEGALASMGTCPVCGRAPAGV